MGFVDGVVDQFCLLVKSLKVGNEVSTVPFHWDCVEGQHASKSPDS